ncbi:MAG: AAA family ATPase [Desulfosporosinus sp.]|nr:AAA family ATPase [Desulfosporosinus sp.]
MDAYDLIPKLIRASFDSDRKTIEAVSLAIIKRIKKDYPDAAGEIAKTLSFSGAGAPMVRSIDMQPLPVDRESRYSLVKLDEPYEIPDPILDDYTMTQLNDFFKERDMINTFLEEGITPPNSILLDGQPGVGKTYIARWISYRLNIPLITLDLASSISSYLGRSGQNIKNIFDYAKSQNAVLFLDELDAIAKRRDDASDLGELKRLVNVLLKELELCPSSCVIIGATNHPELLDKAIWRRFDRSLTVSMPAEIERKNLILRHLDKYVPRLKQDTLLYLTKHAGSINAADICKLCEHIKRQCILNPEMQLDLIALSELYKVITYTSKDEKIQICQMLKRDFNNLSQRDISQITNIPLTSVTRYLTANSRIKEGK